jgi:hypothetical protein
MNSATHQNVSPQPVQPRNAAGKPVQTSQSDGQIICPLTGQKIPACCCPVRK